MTSLGLMTNQIRSTSRYTVYAKEAVRLGFDSVLLFTPQDVRLARKSVTAYRYESGRWVRRLCKLPDVAHDLGFYDDAGTIRQVKAVKSINKSGILFTGYALGHKWQIHARLMQTPYAAYLPETRLMNSAATVFRMANRHKAVIVKPKNGRRGRGIVKIFVHSGEKRSYLWKEGGGAEYELTERQLADKLRRRFRPGETLVQRWMDIRCPKGGVYDLRALMQKVEGDVWRLTEMAVRQSGKGRIASNVAKGGSVRSVPVFLAELYGEAEAERITEECRALAMELPRTLERVYGKRFAELGIDLAVERGGAVRIIEVNIKPGKKIVRALSGEEAYTDALLAPIRYARWLSDRRGSLWKGL